LLFFILRIAAEVSDLPERVYWERLMSVGLIKEFRRRPLADTVFTPVHVLGAPVSQTLLEERR